MEKDKKEIGMEKLIRYLLESKGEEYKEEYYEWYRDVELEQNIDSLSELRLFVKWLVENDKIDIDNEELISLMSELGEFEQYEKCLLMLLALSDEPINDLISFLKDE